MAINNDFRSARNANDDERDVGLAALKAAATHLGLEFPLLYARVDLVRDFHGSPRVLELEIAEPSLSLPLFQNSASRFAKAIRELVERGLN